MSRTRIILFGAGGQVGRSLADAAPAGLPPIGFDRQAADITDPAAIEAALDEAQAAASGGVGLVAVNAAANTAVDRAESEPDRAFAINRDGAGLLAAACARRKLPLIHLSTDYVFGGRTGGPWREDDPPAPVNLYGASKLAGEEAVGAAHPHAVILRTAWVYSPYGGNFVKTMLRLAGERSALRVVDDQTGSPTSARMIAVAILAVADRLAGDPDGAPAGVFHFAGAGAVTRFGFAEAIFAEAARHGRARPALTPIGSDAMPTPARRPANSALDCSRIAAEFGLEVPPWTDGLPPVVAALCAARPSDAAPAQP